ncbi:MAG: SDR family oxidoreductase [Thermoguttaceae bacterium]|jgi:NAD(P)-dependent dehydrogenase (short-subunit alcohol dehydrogenase family)|nr:SDR family oxidoreductase [Thermoguttaceae bacterium]
MHLQDKVILITGGTSGIGEACSELFARHGAKVIAMSIQQEAGTALAKRLTDEGHVCLFHYGDTSRESDVAAAVELAVKQFGRLDCVHANAGVLRNQKITDITLDDFYALINVNLLGPVLVAKHAIPVMERQGKGVICFTTSVAAEIGFPAHGVYCASKAAVVALMRSLTTDHSPKGIRFVAVSPGTIDTPMLAASCAGWDTPKDVLYAQVAKKIPVQRMGKPIDVAHVVGFLFTDEAGFVNGSVVHLEGGTLCLPPW